MGGTCGVNPARGRSPCSSCERGVEQRPGTCTPNPPRAARDLSRRRPSSRNPAIEKTPARVSRSFDRPRSQMHPASSTRAARDRAAGTGSGDAAGGSAHATVISRDFRSSAAEIGPRSVPRPGPRSTHPPRRVGRTRNSHPFPSRHPRRNNNRSTTLVFSPARSPYRRPRTNPPHERVTYLNAIPDARDTHHRDRLPIADRVDREVSGRVDGG